MLRVGDVAGREHVRRARAEAVVVRTPSSTSRPAASASSTRGATPTPMTTGRRRQRRPCGRARRTPARSRPRCPSRARSSTPWRRVDVAVDRADLRAEHALERHLLRGHDRHLGAALLRGRGDLAADPAGADDDDAGARRECIAQSGRCRARCAGRRRPAAPGRGRRFGAGAGREQKLIEAEPLAAVEHDLATRRARARSTVVLRCAARRRVRRTSPPPAPRWRRGRRRRAGSPSTAAGARRAPRPPRRAARRARRSPRPAAPRRPSRRRGRRRRSRTSGHSSDPPIARCQELLAGTWILAHEAVQRRRDRPRAGLLDTAQRHAEVLRLEHDADAARRQMRLQPVGDLLRQALLHLQVAREQVDDPGQLRKADDPVAGQVADVRDAGERQQVVLAQRVERDRAGRRRARRSRSSLGNVVGSNGTGVSSSA